jgi:photosystem II stability/assembly factor-like uncharacterized protein
MVKQFLNIPGAIVMLASALTVAHAVAGDTLDVPASPSRLASLSPLFSVARADKRLIAVGQRGHILISDDAGRRWQQVPVPVSADLTALHFPTAASGWVVGHDGVILHSADGGRTWVKQLDGRQAAKLIVSHYAHHGPRDSPAVVAIVAEARRMLTEGPDQPFLNVWFENEKTGYATGAFNLILKTTNGGQSWVPISELTDNPNGYHLYGISASGSDLYIAGELGLLMKLDRNSGRFSAIPTPYKGSYFGLLTKPGLVVAFGMRGNAWRSEDAGKTWQKIETGIQSGLNAGTVLDDGRIVLASQNGNVLVSADNARSFRPAHDIKPLPIFGVAAAGASRLALVGYRGTQTATLK